MNVAAVRVEHPNGPRGRSYSDRITGERGEEAT